MLLYLGSFLSVNISSHRCHNQIMPKKWEKKKKKHIVLQLDTEMMHFELVYSCELTVYICKSVLYDALRPNKKS